MTSGKFDDYPQQPISSEVDMRSAWNTISPAYQERYQIGVSRIHYGPLCPSEDELGLLGEVHGQDILELGAGAGQNSIHLANRGASCVAVDISDKQLEHGRQLAEKHNASVTFVRASFSDFAEKFSEEQFDKVLSVYALQYCYDNEELSTTFRGIAKVLRPGGDFVFSVDHPVRAVGAWDENDSFTLDNYYDRSQKRWRYSFPEANVAPQMGCNYKIISDYVGAVVGAGLIIKSLLEPEPVESDDNSRFGLLSHFGEGSVRDPFSYDHLSRIPGTLLIKASKSTSGMIKK